MHVPAQHSIPKISCFHPVRTFPPLVNRIRWVKPDGTVSTIAGNGASSQSTGPTPGTVSHPFSVAVRSDGLIAIGNDEAGTITGVSIISIDHTYMFQLISGAIGSVDGNVGTAQVHRLLDMSFAPNGNLIVADFNKHRVREVSLSV